MPKKSTLKQLIDAPLVIIEESPEPAKSDHEVHDKTPLVRDPPSKKKKDQTKEIIDADRRFQEMLALLKEQSDKIEEIERAAQKREKEAEKRKAERRAEKEARQKKDADEQRKTLRELVTGMKGSLKEENDRKLALLRAQWGGKY